MTIATACNSTGSKNRKYTTSVGFHTPVGNYWYTPKGKRVKSLLEKCYLPENFYCLKKLFTWLYESDEWAKKYTKQESDIPGQRVRYVMNHLCPNLQHRFKPRPFDAGNDRDIIEHAHFLENTQATVVNENDEIEQDGVHYTKSEFNEIVRFVENIGTTEGIKQRYRVLRAEAEKDMKLSDMMHCIGLDYRMPYVRNGKLFYKPYRNYYGASSKDGITKMLINSGLATGRTIGDDDGIYWLKKIADTKGIEFAISNTDCLSKTMFVSFGDYMSHLERYNCKIRRCACA